MNGLCVRAAGATRQCAPAALDRALLGGPSTSPLDAHAGSVGRLRTLVGDANT